MHNDILFLHTLQFPRAHCQKCHALFKVIPRNAKGQFQCPVCQVRYIINGQNPIERFRAHFRANHLYLDFENPLEHGSLLASIAAQVLQQGASYPAFRGLLQALSQSKKIVHFTTFGMSKEIFFVLKLASQRVHVRGIVSLPREQTWLIDELKNHVEESPNLQIKVVRPSTRSWNSLPHQKLLIIDGLLAFKGSANLTISGWRKASLGYDEVEVVTDLSRVIELNNRYFSPIWASLSECSNTIFSEPSQK